MNDADEIFLLSFALATAYNALEAIAKGKPDPEAVAERAIASLRRLIPEIGVPGDQPIEPIG